MKSFNNFISETSSGSKGSGYMPVWDDPDDPNGVDPKKNQNKSDNSTSKKKSSKSDTPKPLSQKSKKKLIKTNQQTGGKVTINTSEVGKKIANKMPSASSILSKIDDPEADKLRDSIAKRPELARLTADKGKENILNRIKSTPPPPPGDQPRVPNLKKGELGQLYRNASKLDPTRAQSVRTTDKINTDLTAKRAKRINPTTGKATPKGVENFAIQQQTKGFSAKGEAGRKAHERAKKIASNPSSKAYKDIQKGIEGTKIKGLNQDSKRASVKKIIKSIPGKTSANSELGKVKGYVEPSDYAGKRAKLASTQELDKIAKDLKTSKSLGAQVDTGKGSIAPTKIKTVVSPSKFSLNTSTRKGKVTPLTTKTSGIKYKDFAKKATGAKSNLRKLKITPKGVASKALGPALAAWNFADNYKTTKGSPLRKFTKAALKTGAYYAGATGGAAVGTAGGSFTGPGAFVTGAIGAIAGGETASNLTDKLFNKVWKPPTTKTKTKEKDKKVAIPPTGGSKGGGYGWKTGITIGPSSKKPKTYSSTPSSTEKLITGGPSKK